MTPTGHGQEVAATRFGRDGRGPNQRRSLTVQEGEGERAAHRDECNCSGGDAQAAACVRHSAPISTPER